jgi:hypothetical protein
MNFSAARRPALMAARRLAMVSTPSPAAGLSTLAGQQVSRTEDLLTNMHLAYLKDNVEEVRQLLNEPKTNHSLHPDASLEDDVARELSNIQDILMKSSSPDLNAIESRVSGLKKHVRSQLYHFA